MTESHVDPRYVLRFLELSLVPLFPSLLFAFSPPRRTHHLVTRGIDRVPSLNLASSLTTYFIMALQANQRAGSCGELMYLIASYDFSDSDQPSFHELLSGRIFLLTPDEFLEFLQGVEDIPPRSLPGYEYEDGVLFFKDTMSHIHNELCAHIAEAILGPMGLGHSPEGTGIPSLRFGFGLEQEFGTSPDSRTRWRTPDVNIVVPREEDATVVMPRQSKMTVEVSYAHRFSRQKLETRYQSYLSDFHQRIKVVLCLDIYYGSGPQRAAKTSQHLDRSAVSLWVLKDGRIETMMDWVPLS